MPVAISARRRRSLARRSAGREGGSIVGDAARARTVSDTARKREQQQTGEHQHGIHTGGAWWRFTCSQSEFGQDRAHALVFGLSESGELVAGQIAIDPAIARELLTPLGRPHHGLDGPLETLPIDRTDRRVAQQASASSRARRRHPAHGVSGLRRRATARRSRCRAHARCPRRSAERTLPGR